MRLVSCFRCLYVRVLGSGLYIKHPRLKEKVEVCPRCKGWGWV